MSRDPFEIVKQIPILDIFDTLNIGYKKTGSNYFLKRDNGEVDESFVIYPETNSVHDNGKTGISGSIIDFVGQHFLGLTSVDMKTSTGRANALRFLTSKGIISPQETDQQFEKSYSKEELLENYDKFTIGGFSQHIQGFLVTRGFTHDWITKNQLRVGEIFADIGFYENFYCSEGGETKAKTVPVFMFPCYDEQATLIGIKLRRKDGKLIWGKKSFAVGKTGLLYDQVDISKMIIVEGEMDYIVLKLLGYNNVVGNLGGVQSLRPKLKSLLSETTTIICLYDNDQAGINGKLALQETFNRKIKEIEYPIRKDSKGIILSDVNDYYSVGYDTKVKWDKLLNAATDVGSDKEFKHKTDFIFIRATLEYYDIIYKTFQQESRVATMMSCTKKELYAKVTNGTIKQYKDLCYHEGGKEGYYNTMDESIIVKHGGDAEAKLHPCIEAVINNLGNNKPNNIEWLHKSILYKLTHINSAYIPALILYGEGDSGKGSYIELIKQILGEDNCQTGLGQRDLEGSFDSYQGDKLLVEFKEVSSGNRRDDKKITDRIKGLINEKTISIHLKFQNAKKVQHKSRFHFSSNHSVPMQLDSKHSGNKRFTVIKTGAKLEKIVFEEFYGEVINNKQIIKEYVARLYETFPEIPKSKTLLALDNKDKRDLENVCEGVANLFFNWFEIKYPNIIRITNPEKNKLLRMYCQEEGEDYTDIKFKQSNFDLGLSHRYEKKTVKIRGKTCRGYYINKTKFELDLIPESLPKEFKESEVDNFIF